LYDVILIRFGEIALKGENRHEFMQQLVKNIKNTIATTGDFSIKKTHGRIYIFPKKEQSEEIIARLKNLPGIVSFSPAISTKADFAMIKEKALTIFKREVANFPTTFKVETKRADKNFPIKSPQVSSKLGAHILENINAEQENKLTVDVHQPEQMLNVEIRRGKAYLFTRTIAGPGGLPVYSTGRGLLLLSGGIDSPVAGWLGMKRGLAIDAVYFHTFPYTGERAKEKVKELTKILSKYCGRIFLHVVHFTEIQRAINEDCPERYTVTMMRRLMYRVANKIAADNHHQVLLNGESLGQVASQTLESIISTDDAADLPVLRPLITMNKNEIINLAKKIGTYQTSIQPYEDCCTVFVPDKPVTRPSLQVARNAEANLNVAQLVEEAIAKTEIIKVESPL